MNILTVKVAQIVQCASDYPDRRSPIQNQGIDVNLFVDHSQAVRLACLRSRIWGTNRTFGYVVNFREWRVKP